MGYKVLCIDDLAQYYENGWLDENIVKGWVDCAEYLLQKHEWDKINFKHKKLIDGTEEDYEIEIKTNNEDVSKVPNTLQDTAIVEWAGVAIGLLITLWLRHPRFFRVTTKGDGYDYRYLPVDCEGEEWELIEVTGTELPGECKRRLGVKIRKFIKKHPQSSGYISVSSFCDKELVHWGHKNVS